MQKPDAIEKNLPFGKHFGTELLVIDHGEGVWLYDIAGNKYLDFGAGIAVNALGYGREDLARTAYEQTKKLIHISNLFATEPALKLANLLVKSGPFSAVHLGNSGSEANEAALKFARLYAKRKKGEGHHNILSFTGAFHGRTYGALSATPNAKYQEPFKPLVPGMLWTEYNNVKELEATLSTEFAAVIVEIIQGEGGLTVMSDEFAAALKALCKKHDVIIIADEVQTGLGRTGSLYASQEAGLEPDIVTLAKPIGGGLPLSATLISAKINDLIQFGEHGSTFGGGPVCAALGLVVWETITAPGFLESVREKGAHIAELYTSLKKEIHSVGELKGKGLLRGIEINAKNGNPEEFIKAVIAAARDKGLLILRSGQNVIRIAPPLVITKEELTLGFDILKQVLASVQ